MAGGDAPLHRQLAQPEIAALGRELVAYYQAVAPENAKKASKVLSDFASRGASSHQLHILNASLKRTYGVGLDPSGVLGSVGDVSYFDYEAEADLFPVLARPVQAPLIPYATERVINYVEYVPALIPAPTWTEAVPELVIVPDVIVPKAPSPVKSPTLLNRPAQRLNAEPTRPKKVPPVPPEEEEEEEEPLLVKAANKVQRSAGPPPPPPPPTIVEREVVIEREVVKEVTVEVPVEKIVTVEVPYEKLVVVEVPKVTTVIQDVPVPFRMPSERIEVKQVLQPMEVIREVPKQMMREVHVTSNAQVNPSVTALEASSQASYDWRVQNVAERTQDALRPSPSAVTQISPRSGKGLRTLVQQQHNEELRALVQKQHDQELSARVQQQHNATQQHNASTQDCKVIHASSHGLPAVASSGPTLSAGVVSPILTHHLPTDVFTQQAPSHSESVSTRLTQEELKALWEQQQQTQRQQQPQQTPTQPWEGWTVTQKQQQETQQPAREVPRGARPSPQNSTVKTLLGQLQNGLITKEEFIAAVIK